MFLSAEGKRRCKVAANLACDGDIIILMGGITKPFHADSEASLMRHFIKMKLENCRNTHCYILLESQSTTTIDNAERAWNLYEDFITDNEVIVITSDYHSERTRLVWSYLLRSKPFQMKTCFSSLGGYSKEFVYRTDRFDGDPFILQWIYQARAYVQNHVPNAEKILKRIVLMRLPQTQPFIIDNSRFFGYSMKSLYFIFIRLGSGPIILNFYGT